MSQKAIKGRSRGAHFLLCYVFAVLHGPRSSKEQIYLLWIVGNAHGHQLLSHGLF